MKPATPRNHVTNGASIGHGHSPARLRSLLGRLSLPGPLDRFDGAILVLLAASYLVVGLMPFGAKRFGDLNFHTEAKALSLAIKGAGSWQDVSLSRAPAPTVYYTIPYLLAPAGASDSTYWQLAFFWTMGWIACSVLLLRRAGSLVAGPFAGKLTALLAVFSPFEVYFSYGVSAEPVAYLGICLFLYGFAKQKEAGNSDRLLRAGFVPGWAGLSLFILSRPNGVLILPIGLLAAIWLWKSAPVACRREAKITMLTVALAGVALLISAFIGRALPHSWQEGNFAHVALQGRFQYRSEPWDWRYWDRTSRSNSSDYAAWLTTMTSLKQQALDTGQSTSSLELGWIWKDVVSHPLITIRQTLIKAVSLQIAVVNSQRPGAFRFGPIGGPALFVIFHVLVNGFGLLLLVASIWFALKRRSGLWSGWALWAPWISLLVFHASTYVETRYMFPAQPGLDIMAGTAIAPVLLRAVDRWRHRGEVQEAASSGERGWRSVLSEISQARH
jgi:hypothetical protein